MLIFNKISVQTIAYFGVKNGSRYISCPEDDVMKFR